MAHQMGLETTAHNVANANTPGYTRQVVQLQATTPFSPPSWISPAIAGQIGTGVEVVAIQRMRDAFLDSQIRQETSSKGRWETQSELLSQIELIFNEPSESGIRTALDDFWKALQDLSLNPESASARTVVLRRGEALADLINHTYLQLQELQRSVNSDIEVKVTEINTYANRIAALNKQIIEASSVGDNPNDLMDQRDLLITELSMIVDINVITDKFNATTVTIGGVPIVEWDRARQLEVRDDDSDGMSEIYWQGSTNTVQFTDGTLRGQMEIRDNYIPAGLKALDNFIFTLESQFNAQHEKGYDFKGAPGNPFFVYNGPGTLRVAITEQEIAASLDSDAVGNGENAKKLANILHGIITIEDRDGNTVAANTTLRDYFIGVMAQLGIDTQHAMRMTENQNVLVNSLQDRMEAVAGVSLDEEMVNMIKFQHAYNAAARVIATMDQIYDTIINGLGVGR